MPGLYVHIPFCSRRCPYCDFAVSVDKRETFRSQYLEALQRELEHQLREHGLLHPSLPCPTVFFGGGTPTELPVEQLNQLLEQMGQCVDLSGSEISLECNPEHLSPAYLQTLARGGWNRLSLGAQSFDPTVLAYLGRQHTPEEIILAVHHAREAGFSNISLDLIYAVPGQDLASWRATLEQAVDLAVPHVSAYSLTLESGTEFGRRVRLGQLVAVEDDLQADHMSLASEVLAHGGLQRYEVSNYAVPGMESRHNQNYWRGGDYLALGSGAHGHRNGHRYWNERSTTRYVRRMLEEGSGRAGEEFLTPRERLEEAVSLALRHTEGFDLQQLSQRLAIDARQELGTKLEEAVRLGWLTRRGTHYLPHPTSLALADSVARHLLT